MKKNINPGDLVTCKHAIDAYYSKYCNNPKMTFRPGMVGKVTSITPKVCILGRGAGVEYDGDPDMIVIDFYFPATRDIQRASLNFCNAKKTTGTIPSPGDTTYATLCRRVFLHRYTGDNATAQLKQDVLDLYGHEHEDRYREIFAEYYTPNKKKLMVVLKEFASIMDDIGNHVLTNP